jgi:hypothetical protein
LGEVAEAKVFTKLATFQWQEVDYSGIVDAAVAETVPPPQS